LKAPGEPYPAGPCNLQQTGTVLLPAWGVPPPLLPPPPPPFNARANTAGLGPPAGCEYGGHPW
jgi:hypothetical protein